MQCAFYCGGTVNFLENYKRQWLYKDTLSNRITEMVKFLELRVTVVTSWKSFLLQ